MERVCPQPSVDHFDLPAQESQNNISLGSYSPEPPLPYPSSQPSPDSCESSRQSPASPTLTYPAYVLPAEAVAAPANAGSKNTEIFNYGSFDDWIGWDDLEPTDNALSSTSDFFPELKMDPVSPQVERLDVQQQQQQLLLQQSRPTATFSTDGPLFQSPSSLTTANSEPARENLYSTPLSWSEPSAGISPQRYSRLSPAEELQLCAIAMPGYTTANGLQNTKPQYPRSPSSASSPEPAHSKRKSMTGEEDMDLDSETEDAESSNQRRSGRPVKKTAHNMIEKRYRTNLNDKIAALRDSVPALRVVTKRNSKGEELQEDLQGLTPAHKLNKATVLAKATEYIAHLEKRNRTLHKENISLKARVDAFETLINNRQQQSQPQRTQIHPRGSGRDQGNGSFGGML